MTIMASRDMPSGPKPDLLRRAAATSLNCARIIARSVELVVRSIEISQAVAHACERASNVRTETLRTKARLIRHAKKPGAVRHIGHVPPLPLTPPRLLELAAEFRALAESAPTPESRAAFHGLAFRYTALAAGYDDQWTGSRTLH
jgi:hypothetical protein